MPLLIRRATPADAPVIVEFNRLLAAESEGLTLNPAVLMPGVQSALADEHKALYFLAEDDGILGQTMVTFEWSDWRNGWIWWIQSVYVRSDARKRGVFRALYEHIAQAARERGVIGIRLYVEEENHVAHKTYERVGMERSGYFVLEQIPL